MLFLPDEHSQPSSNHILCACMSLCPLCWLCAHRLQSGQSLIEHSYKADSDLSPAGWEYAERLRAAVIARRKQVAEEKKARGEEWKDRKLVVSQLGSRFRPRLMRGRSGRRRGEGHIIRRGHLRSQDTRSSRSRK